MKKLMIAVCMMICIATNANADLIDRGGGLIYDTDLNITWMQDTNPTYMTWQNAMAWASALEYQGYDDWRLPSMTINYMNWTTNPNCAEMAHLSLVDQINYDNPGPFTIGRNYYWANNAKGSIVAFSSNYPVTEFYTNRWSGGERLGAWAVRNGDSTPVPEPATMFLLGSGLIGLAGVIRKRFSKK